MKSAPKKPCKPLTVRQEEFAQQVASGEILAKAYAKAGYSSKGNGAHANASRLMGNDSVAARIAEIRALATKLGDAVAALTIAEKLEFLAKVVRANPEDVGPDSPLCQEFVRDEVAGGARGTLKRGKAPRGNESVEPVVIRTKVKLMDKLRAIELHSKLAGHFKPEELIIDAGPVTLTTIKEIAARIRVSSPLLMHKMASAGIPRRAAADQAVPGGKPQESKAPPTPRPLSQAWKRNPPPY